MIDPDTGSMIRVDQAGEYGATRIYAGQLTVLGNRSKIASKIAGMAAAEERHLACFDRMMVERGVAPTMLQPLWSVAGYGLGVITAMIGPEAAMACTAAVETEIDHHYGQQLDELGTSDPELSASVTEFRAEEVEHKHAALAAGAENAPGFMLMTMAIRLGCRAAIALSKRI